MIQQIMPAVTGFVAALIPVIGQVIATLMPIIPTVLTPIMDAVTQMAPVSAASSPRSSDSSKRPCYPPSRRPSRTSPASLNSIGTVRTSLVNIISGVINMIAGILNGNWTQVWEGFKQVVSGAVQALGGIVSGIKDIILGALAGAGTWLRNAGKAIIQGLIDGIMSMINAAGDAIGWVMDKISSFIPHSPAKRGPFSGRGWTTYSGQAIVEGSPRASRTTRARPNRRYKPPCSVPKPPPTASNSPTGASNPPPSPTQPAPRRTPPASGRWRGTR